MLKQAHLAIALVLTSLFLIAGLAVAPSKASIANGNWMAQRGVMSAKDYYRPDDMQFKIENGGTVTDEDLRFTIHVLETKPPNPKETVFRRSQAIAFGVTVYKHWTAGQKDKLFQAALWLLAQPEPKNQVDGNDPLTTDKLPAMWLLNAVHDKRTLPYFRALEKDANRLIAGEATNYYKKIARGSQ